MKAGDRGQAIVEFAIVFPFQLLIVLGLLQLLQVFVAKHALVYAAFAAARAEMVGEPGEDAAAMILAPVSGDTPVPGRGRPAPFRFPGWGAEPKSPWARGKTRVFRETELGVERVRVEHDLELWIPFADLAFDWDGRPNNHGGARHITMEETARIPRPWLAP